MKKAIDWIALVVGVALALFGAKWMWTGWDIVQAERGWAAVIAGSVMLSGGLIVAMLAWTVMRITGANGAVARRAASVDEAPANTGVPEAGILDTKLAANPVRTWNIGYVPYCDGSLFSGDVDIDDDGDGTIDRYHRGLRNLSAALDVIHTAFPHPKRILLTGASAGAYGTVLATALVRQYYPTPDLMVIADGSAGLGKPEDPGFVTSLLDEWNIAHLLPASCVDCVADGNLTKLIAWGLDQDPTIEMGTISSYGDFVIGTTFLGIGPDAYGEAVRAATGSLAASHPQRYHRFLFAGTKHTTISIDSTTNLDDVDFNGLPLSGGLGEILGRFDVTAVEGVTVADWVGYLVAGSPMWVDELAPASAH